LLEYISLDIQKLITFYESEHQGQECQDLAVTQTNTETTDRVAGYLRAAHDKRFPLRVPRAFADRIVPNQPGDPLLRQVLPLPAEQVIAPGYNTDPLAEQDSLKGQGLLQKYQGRLLVVAHGSCAVHCRYCFRRHFPYDTQQLPPQHWQALASHLAQDTSLDEVILSGGDPLTLKNRQLQQLNPILTANPHIKRLRIHTRFPIMIPDRIDAGFVAWANTLPIPLSIVFHINHANEIDSQVTKVLKTLKSETKALLLNQSVLLKNVNDSVPALQSLQELLIENGIMPYYLHVLDPIQGAQHFDVPDTKALSLLKSLQQRLPGYMVPKLVREMPGADSKTLLTPN
jgi:EF-P beta-lysylation protein EpmB